MDVKVRFRHIDFIDFVTEPSPAGEEDPNVVVAKLKTVGDVKRELHNHHNFDDHEDWDEWKLFLFGVELDDMDTPLASLVTPETGGKVPEINLVAPPDIERVGTKKQPFYTDKTRFLVIRTEAGFEIMTVRPEQLTTAECPQEYFFLGDAKFGLITHVDTKVGKEEEQLVGEREITCNVYKVRSSQQGWICLWTDDLKASQGIDSKQVVYLISDKNAQKPDLRKEPDRRTAIPLEPVMREVYKEKQLKKKQNITFAHIAKALAHIDNKTL